MPEVSTFPPPASSKRRCYAAARGLSRRWPLNAQVKFFGQHKATGVTLNASDGGLRVAVDRQLTTGDVCTMQIMYDVDRPEVRRGEVVWTHELRDGCIAGFKFVDAA